MLLWGRLHLLADTGKRGMSCTLACHYLAISLPCPACLSTVCPMAHPPCSSSSQLTARTSPSRWRFKVLLCESLPPSPASQTGQGLSKGNPKMSCRPRTHPGHEEQGPCSGTDGAVHTALSLVFCSQLWTRCCCVLAQSPFSGAKQAS